MRDIKRSKDFNFFHAYNKRADYNRKTAVLMISLLIFTGIVTFFVFTLNYLLDLQIQSVQYEISSVRLDIQKNSNELDRYSRLNDRLNSLTAYNGMVDLLSEQIEHGSYINTALMKSITDSMPKDIVVSSMSVSFDTMTLSAKGESEVSIAEFERNIRTLKHVDSVLVGSISGSAEEYSFSMSIRMKEVAVYEEKK